MTANNESLTEGQIAKLARKLFGPEEEWDEAQAEFVLKLYGVDTEDATAYGINLLNNVIRRMCERRKEVPQPILTLLAKLEQEAKKNVTE